MLYYTIFYGLFQIKRKQNKMTWDILLIRIGNHIKAVRKPIFVIVPMRRDDFRYTPATR